MFCRNYFINSDNNPVVRDIRLDFTDGKGTEDFSVKDWPRILAGTKWKQGLNPQYAILTSLPDYLF